MTRKPFRFKQFDIYQDKTAMKVGTDGVLLGSWANLQSGSKVLDIGTGTGLIAMMLAQRFKESEITAIEIDDKAYDQAVENVLNSKFSNQIQVTKSALQEFDIDSKFDLIVSNPPFFINNERVELDSRKTARQQETLTFEDLLFYTSKLLDLDGCASFVIPFDLESNFLEIAKNLNLFATNILHIKGNDVVEIKRSLIELRFNSQETSYNVLVVEEARHQYTQDYINLTKEFYLKM